MSLVIGTLAGFITMAFHPTGAEVVANAAAGGRNVLAVAMHLLALCGLPFVLAGLLGFTVMLRRRDLAVLGFAFYLLGAVAAMIAAIASGLIAPEVAQLVTTTGMSALRYTRLINQSFAVIYAVLTAVALVVWSAALVIGRDGYTRLAIYGLVVGPVLLIVVVGGLLPLNVHGFGVVVGAQGIWCLSVASLLWARRAPSEGPVVRVA
jgi:hypothetical protein